MSHEQILFILDSIKTAIHNNIDLFFINTSVFFFANTYIQSQKSWEDNLKKTTAKSLQWETIVSFKEDANLPVTDENMKMHPDWTILFPVEPIKEISIAEYRDYLAYQNYDEAYETKYASEKKDRYAALYGAILLILGSYFSLQKNCENTVVAISVLLIYVMMAIILIRVFPHGIAPMTKVKKRPDRPSFLDK